MSVLVVDVILVVVVDVVEVAVVVVVVAEEYAVMFSRATFIFSSKFRVSLALHFKD